MCRRGISMEMSVMRTRCWSHWDQDGFWDGGGKGRGREGQIESCEGQPCLNRLLAVLGRKMLGFIPISYSEL